MPAKMFRQGRHTYFRGSSFATGPAAPVTEANPLTGALGALTAAMTATAGAGGAFLPSDIAGLQGWYDSSDATTFTFSSSTVVSQWRDKSGNTRHWSQGTVANQPNRNGVQNALATVAFDGNDYLDTAAFTVSQPMTVFIARDLFNIPSGNRSNFGSVAASLQLDWGTATAWSYYAGTAVIDGWTTGHIGAHILEYLLNGASSSAFKDGVAGVAGNPGTAGTTTGLRLGAERNLANYFQGTNFEILVYNSVLSTTDRQNVENYLTNKWMAFTPSSIAGLQGWWDSSDAASFTYSSGTEISQWRDKSGNARHFAQATVSKQPALNGTQNGKSKILYTKANGDELLTSAFTVTNPYTLFFAGKQTFGTAVELSPLSAIGGDELQIYTTGSGSQMAVHPVGLNHSRDAQDNNPNVFCLLVSPTIGCHFYRNGVLRVTSGSSALGITLGLRTSERNGSSGYWYEDDHYEILVYQGALSTTDRNTVEAYLKAKWGIPQGVSDSFNRADNASSMGNTDTGQAWVPNSGTWGITSNLAYLNSAHAQATTVVESGLADCVVQVTTTVAGDCGLCWRSTDDVNNFLTNGSVGAYKRVANSFTQVASGAGPAHGDVIKVTTSGTSHTLLKNGAAWMSFTESFNQSATKHGIRCQADSALRFNDFSVTP